MSIEYCHTHDKRWDSDWHETCPDCALDGELLDDLFEVTNASHEARELIEGRQIVRHDDNDAELSDFASAARKFMNAYRNLIAAPSAPEPPVQDEPPSPPIYGVRTTSGMM